MATSLQTAFLYFLNIVFIFFEISVKVVPKYLINNIAALVQIGAWCRPDDESLYEPMMA